MRGGSQSTDIAQAVVEAPTDQASAAQEPTYVELAPMRGFLSPLNDGFCLSRKQEKETAEEDEGLTSWRSASVVCVNS